MWGQTTTDFPLVDNNKSQLVLCGKFLDIKLLFLWRLHSSEHYRETHQVVPDTLFDNKEGIVDHAGGEGRLVNEVQADRLSTKQTCHI